MLIYVDQGSKTLRYQNTVYEVQSKQMIAIVAGKSLDVIINQPASHHHPYLVS